MRRVNRSNTLPLFPTKLHTSTGVLNIPLRDARENVEILGAKGVAVDPLRWHVAGNARSVGSARRVSERSYEQALKENLFNRQLPPRSACGRRHAGTRPGSPL